VIKAILFDLDDTLLDRTASLICFIRDHFQRYGLDHLPYDTYQARFLELDQRGYAPKPRMFQSLIDEFALPAAVGTLLADFQDGAWHSCTLLPGARDVLLCSRCARAAIGSALSPTARIGRRCASCAPPAYCRWSTRC
jgi:putative hydrolase of the HAD superfamily